MRNIKGTTLRNISFTFVVVLLVLFIAVAFMTYAATPDGVGYSAFAVQHHLEIMAALVVIAIVFGFAFSQFFYTEMKRNRQQSQDILGIVLQFLNQEERAIINLLVEHGGTTNQAEVARLPHMSRVKAHRSLQKMQEKQLVELVPHGKMRKVHLKGNILQLLIEKK